ncbi:MAG: M50 family metallopeptidase [Prolixibacteraceae bacterium]|nr:M50 family metallopeptidase [Prolixibacteraceae bacterium]
MEIGHYLKITFVVFLEQLLFFFGPVLAFTLLMTLLSRAIEKTALSLLGTKAYLIIFGWLGTAFHELSHALFALLFGHKIDEIQLFKPDKETGSLGYVSHRYHPRNWYHQLGNFFIGIGPVIVGTALLFLLFYLLFGIGIGDLPPFRFDDATIQTGDGLITQIQLSVQSLQYLFNEVFKGPQSSWWRIALLLYCSITLGSSITLSRSDVNTAFWGFLMLIFLLLLFNLATGWIDGFPDMVLRTISVIISLFSTLMIIALLVNIVMLGIMALLLMLKRAIASRP